MTLCSLSPITERLTVSTRKRQIIGSVVAWYGQSDSVHYAISYAFLYVQQESSDLLLGGGAADDQKQGVQPRHSARDDAGQFSGCGGVGRCERFHPRDGISRDDGVVCNCLGREGMFAVHPETKKIAGQQEVDGLAPPVGSKGEPPCRTRDNPVPALDGPLGAIRSLRHAGTEPAGRAPPALALSIEVSRQARASTPALEYLGQVD